MNKEDENNSWFNRIRQFLQIEPQDQKELINLLRDAHSRSLINSDALAIIEGALIFSTMRARDIMLPKQQMVCIAHENTFQEIIETVTRTGHSRFPVTGENPNEIVGILHAKDLLIYNTDNSVAFDLLDICRQVMFIPESKPLDNLLSEFRRNKNHMAIVVNEYGELAGFVTIEDIIEQIVGDIEDEFDIDEEAYIKAHGDHYYIVKGHTPIDEFNEQLDANFSDETYDTIGGVLMNSFGHLPKKGDVIQLEQFEFKVINADSRRIKLLACHDRRVPNE